MLTCAHCFIQLSTTATDLHQLQSYVRATNAHVQNRFTTLIDVCWPRKAGAAQEADAESVEAVRRRLMAKRKAFYADWQQDKTMDLLRVLAAASAPAEAFMMSPMGPGSALATPRARSMMAESPLAKSSTVASSIAASTLAKSSSATPSSSSAVASPTPASPFPMDLDE